MTSILFNPCGFVSHYLYHIIKFFLSPPGLSRHCQVPPGLGGRLHQTAAPALSDVHQPEVWSDQGVLHPQSGRARRPQGPRAAPQGLPAELKIDSEQLTWRRSLWYMSLCGKWGGGGRGISYRCGVFLLQLS